MDEGIYGDAASCQISLDTKFCLGMKVVKLRVRYLLLPGGSEKSVLSCTRIVHLFPHQASFCPIISVYLCARDFTVSCAVVWNFLQLDLRVLSVTAAAFAKHLDLLVFLPGLAHLRTIYFVEYKCMHYYYYF